ncbi:MAG: hypothetical protein ACE15B_15000 [Bryobacteraceae bacterium]
MKAVALVLAALVLAACNRGIENKEAVRQAIIDYLANRKNLNVASMSVDVSSVTFKGSEAEAMVAFAPKGGGGGQGMSMRYVLEKQGGRWVVKGRGDSGQGHGGAMPMPAPAPGEMPPGHPPAGGAKK